MVPLPASRQEEMPWVVLRLGPHRLALSAAWVREMAVLPEVTVLPGSMPHLRGMMDLRGEAMPLMDLRRRLGMPSLSHEARKLTQDLSRQEHSHRQWLKELEDAVSQGRPFTQELDPGQCSLGLWLKRRQARGEALAHLSRLESPHRQAHQAAGEVAALLAKGRNEQAALALARAQTGPLARLLRAMEECRRDLRQPQREIALVVQTEDALLALAVDEVEAVEPLEPSGVRWSQADMGQLNQNLLAGAAQHPESGKIIFLLDLELLLDEGRGLIPETLPAEP